MVAAPGCALPGRALAPTLDTSHGEILVTLLSLFIPSSLPLHISYIHFSAEGASCLLLSCFPRSLIPLFRLLPVYPFPTDRLVHLFPLVWLLYIVSSCASLLFLARARSHFLLPLSVALASRLPLLLNLALFSLPASSLPARRTFDSNRRDLKVKRPLLAKLPGSPTTRDGCSLQAMRCYLVGSCMFKSLSFLRSTLGIGQPSVLASSPFLT